MESIKEKYQRLRPLITDGCIVLVRNPKNIGRVISYCDMAYWTHVRTSIYGEYAGERRLMCLEESFEGAAPAFMSTNMHLYSDMLVMKPIRPREVIDTALNFMANAAELGVPYAYKAGMIGLGERFAKNHLNWDLKINWDDQKQKMCSTWGQQFALQMDIPDFKNVWRMMPQDFIRYYNRNNWTVLM